CEFDFTALVNSNRSAPQPRGFLRKAGLTVSLLVVGLTLGKWLASWCPRATRLRQNQAQRKPLAKLESAELQATTLEKVLPRQAPGNSAARLGFSSARAGTHCRRCSCGRKGSTTQASAQRKFRPST